MLKHSDSRFLAALSAPWLLWGAGTVMLLPRIAEGQWGWALALYMGSGLLQYWCIIGIHEAIHQYFIRRNRLNWLVALLCAFPIGLDRNYSWIHLDHHKFFPDISRDPDGPMYRDYPQTLGAWLWRLLLISSGLSVIQQVFEQRRHLAQRAPTARYFPREMIWKIFVQLVLLGLFWLLGFWPGYFLFWLLPLVTIAKLLSFLRTFAEHAHPQYPGALRIFSEPSWLDRYLAYFGFLFHSEHHLRTNVPYAELPQQSLLRSGLRPAGSLVIVVYTGGHLQWHCQLIKFLCRSAWRRERLTDPSVYHEQILHLPIVPRPTVQNGPVGNS